MDTQKEGSLLKPRNVRPFLIGAIVATGTIVITSYVVAKESLVNCANLLHPVVSESVQAEPVKQVSVESVQAAPESK